MRITRREKKFWEQHLSCVRHITLDPKGPGVVRLHMIPPRAEGKDEPFLLLLNGAKLIPLNLSWAILLANFMAALEHFFTEGDNAPDREVKQADWERLAEEAVTATRSVYPRTKPEQLREDLALLMESLIAIARGQEPPVEVGTLSLGDYAPYMSAPHRMDLMVSAMTQDGAWHCNQKCLHCYAAGQPMGESRELTTAQWKEALERLRHANIPQVTFTGGEPTLRADLVELVDDAMGDDYAKLGGLTSEEDLREPAAVSMKKRLPWLIVLLFLGMGVSSVVGIFESVVAVLPIVICFQSLVLDMAGNVGTQSLAVTIRVLMDENLTLKEELALLGKEMRVGLLNGGCLGLMALAVLGVYIHVCKGYAWGPAFLISGCVGVSLVVAMVISSLVGTMVPMLFHKIHIDPAVASGPLITTVNDLVAVVTYYGLALLFLVNVFHL